MHFTAVPVIGVRQFGSGSPFIITVRIIAKMNEHHEVNSACTNGNRVICINLIICRALVK